MMLKVTTRPRLAVIIATTAMTFAAVVFAGLASAGSAFANHAWNSEPPTLNGDWAPLNRCPVDNPAMLAVTGTGVEALCVEEATPSGSMTIGGLTVALKDTNHQYGVIENEEGVPSPTVAPPGGVLVSEPVALAGGIQELLCPSNERFARHLCQDSHHRRWADHAEPVAWTLESAGVITNFSLFAGLAPGTPIATVPLKIHLQSRLLGDNCYIGSESEPIVVNPANLAVPEVEFKMFDGNGTPNQETGALLDLASHGAPQNASAFAVPAASDCGFRGFFDQAIDNKVGLPSSASTNNLTFNEGVTNLVTLSDPESVAPNDGKVLAEDWHSAVIPPEKGHGSGNEHRIGRHWSREEAEENIRHWFGRRH